MAFNQSILLLFVSNLFFIQVAYETLNRLKRVCKYSFIPIPVDPTFFGTKFPSEE